MSFDPRSRSRHAVLGIVLASFASLVLLACGGSDPDADTASEAGGPAPGEEAAAAGLETGRTVVDVRTPEEYEAGHVEGATLIDIQGPDFAEQISELDADGEYIVYCRSGNRSAAAAAQMDEIGLDVTDGGGLDDMLAAGWPEAE